MRADGGGSVGLAMNGRRFRNIVDDVTKECVGTSIFGRRAARSWQFVGWRGKASPIVADNGTEFTRRAILAWCKDHLRQPKAAPEGRLFDSNADRQLCEAKREPVLATISHEAHPREAENHHRPSRGLGHRRD